MKRLWMSGAAAVMAMSIASVGAQTPQTPPPSQTPPPASMQQSATTTLTGCVYNEADVPGRTPNVAERAGVLEDYILVTTAASGTAGTSGTTPPATGAAAMASAVGKAFKLEQIADERLKAVVGKRVEVTGRVDTEAGTTGAKPDKNPGSPDSIELPEFEVTSLKEVEGTCPAKPEIKK